MKSNSFDPFNTTQGKQVQDTWKAKLSPEQYKIMREKGTEAPFIGKYANFHEKGVFLCSACGVELFSSDAKFDSKSGWPSFTEPFGFKDSSGSERPANLTNVELKEDSSHGMSRIEVLCRNCGSHLGHVFEDGPKGKKRYCINSICLKFEV